MRHRLPLLRYNSDILPSSARSEDLDFVREHFLPVGEEEGGSACPVFCGEGGDEGVAEHAGVAVEVSARGIGGPDGAVGEAGGFVVG